MECRGGDGVEGEEIRCWSLRWSWSWSRDTVADRVAPGLHSGRGGREQLTGAPIVGPLVDWAGRGGLPGAHAWYFTLATCLATEEFF